MQSRERRKRKPQEINGSCRAARRRHRGRDCNKRQAQCSIAAGELSWCFSRVSVSSCRFAHLRAARRAHAAGHVFIAFPVSSAAVPHRALRVRRACVREPLFASFPFLRSSLSFVAPFVFRFPVLSLFSSSFRSHSRGFARRGASSVALSSDKFARFTTFVSLFPRLCVLLFASLFHVASLFTPLPLSSRCRLLVSQSSLCLLRLFVLGPARDAASGFGSLGNS